ncbi:MAG: hypothetical protein Q8Q52_07345 [Acidimicrobiia bacterium]|nr:hypothetical protein [Acidimicrobiia bacterium]
MAANLVAWATRDVRSLHYLLAVDDEAMDSGEARGWSLEIVDNAHPRWAATTAISAVDRCAAALARVTPTVNTTGSREATVRWLAAKRLSQLSAGGRRWVTSVTADPFHNSLVELRNGLVHRHLRRVVRAVVGQGDWEGQRDSLILEGREYHVRGLIEASRDFADTHVSAFLAAARRGTLNV